jgi:hypothetical protein
MDAHDHSALTERGTQNSPSLHPTHNVCGTPSCSLFHLFCHDCGARHHVSDQQPASASSAAIAVAG